MKTDIHPKWYPEAAVTCSCGSTFKVGATKPEFKLEICSKCHPFYTGEMRFVDSLGRVEKFQKKQASAQVHAAKLAEKKAKKAERETASRTQKSLKEMLSSLR